MPIVSLVAVAAAGLAELYGRHPDASHLLGAAARLRGAHDRSDPQIRELTERIRAALGEDVFTEAYQSGWQLDGRTASAQVDPARLRRAALPAADGQPQPTADGKAQPTADGQARPVAEGQARPTADGQARPVAEGQARRA
jgi:hypothetical protein